jgi:hypothetical protein
MSGVQACRNAHAEGPKWVPRRYVSIRGEQRVAARVCAGGHSRGGYLADVGGAGGNQFKERCICKVAKGCFTFKIEAWVDWCESRRSGHQQGVGDDSRLTLLSHL